MSSLRENKKQKVEQKGSEILIEIQPATEQGVPKVVRCLLDTGSSGCILLNEFTTGYGAVKAETTKWMTKGGIYQTTKKCKLPFKLVEFDMQTTVNWEFHVDETSKSESSNYDMIVGRDLLGELGMDICFSTSTIHWRGVSVPMRDYGDLRSRQAAHLIYVENFETEITKSVSKRVNQILDAKYEKANLVQITDNCTHLTKQQKQKLLTLLQKYEDLFDGTLGGWKGTDIKLDLIPNAKPFHSAPFPVPQIHEATLRKEVDRLVLLGVLERDNSSEWAAPTFIIPKKNLTVRFISDFRKLNSMLRRRPYPIPKIQEMLQKLEGFQYALSIDLNMGYYTIRLNPDAQKICTIVLPWGKYKYKRLPMGISGAPDIFQEKMSELMLDLEFVRTYLDDVLVVSKNTFEDHLNKLEITLQRIQKVGLKVNADKSFFARTEIEYLGHWVTRHGIMPLSNKVKAILELSPPKNRKQLRGFIGMVNYYRDMWRSRSHILAPLTKLTSDKVPWKWTDVEQKAFDDMKKAISKEVLLSFPDFNEDFEVYTDASKVQLGAVIMQKGKPLAFYSRKLNDAQTRYTTTERELLSIVETLKEFRTILLGHKIKIFTDHKNLIHTNLRTERVLRWRLYLEEYNLEFNYIAGIKNIVADILSRYPTNNQPEASQKPPTVEQMAEIFDTEVLPASIFPLSTALIIQYQQKDSQLLEKSKNNKEFSTKAFRGGDQVICQNDKIYIPTELRHHIVRWYHEMLLHPGESRTEETIRQHMTWPNLRHDVQSHVKKCRSCQIHKTRHQKYGKLPPKVAEAQPWEQLCVDLIGPYLIRRKDKPPLRLMAVTMIDPATGWFEIRETKTKTSDVIANHVEIAWLTRYPWPVHITYDHGGEFLGQEFQALIKEEYGIKARQASKRNPQANAILERVHATLGNMIKTFEVQDRDMDEEDPWIGILSAVAWAICSTYHTTMQATPGQLVFGRDMIWNLPHIADWRYIQQRKQDLINKNNERENSKRIEHDYAVGDKVLKRLSNTYKLERSKDGPYEIIRVHTNGTVTIQNGTITERLNICQIDPYHG